MSEAGSKPPASKATSQAFAGFFFCILELSFVFTCTLGQQGFILVMQRWGCKRGDCGLRVVWGLSSFFLLTLMRKSMSVSQLSLHLITMTEEISHLPVSGMGND